MVKKISRAQRREQFLQYALEAFEALEEWYDEHPEATFEEIEQEARRRRRELMGKTIEIVINGRSTGHELEPPRCPQCGEAMEFHEYRGKLVRGLEGNSRLQRAYYICPQGCRETFFPPGSNPCTAQGSME
jgi:hypothetical protein